MRLPAPFVVALVLWASLLRAEDAKLQVPRVVTTGASTVMVPADRARLTIGVTAKAQKAKDAAAKVALLMNSVRDALVGLGFERSALVSAGYSVSTQDDPEGRTVKGYSASSTLSAELSNLSQLGGVVDAVLAAGATDIAEIEFVAKDKEAARDRALDAAFRQAHRDAEVLARAAGARLARLVSVSTERAFGYNSEEKITVSAEPAGRSTHIPAPEVSIAASVRAEWQLDFAMPERP